VKLRGRKYWRKRQTCNGKVAAVDDIEYGGRIPFLGCPGGSVINTFKIQGLTYLMGDEKELKAVATSPADADILTAHGGFTIPIVATETPG
jgi:nitrogenase subunit NifH